MSPLLIDILYLVASGLIVVGLWKLLKADHTARGKMLMAGGLGLAALVTLAADEVRGSIGLALIAMLAAAAGGALFGYRVNRDALQARLVLLVALAGLATALVPLVRLHEASRQVAVTAEINKEAWKNIPEEIRKINEAEYALPIPLRMSFPAVLATVLGGIVTIAAGLSYLKVTKSPLRKSLPKLEDASLPSLGAIVVCAFLALLFCAWPTRVAFLWLELIAAMSLGYMLTIHLKIADVPPVLAAALATLGLAIAAAGMVIGNEVMITCGALVASGGAVLARSLADSMNVSLLGLVRGTESSKKAAAAESGSTPPPLPNIPEPRTRTPDPDTPIL
ncbi:MAG TPA: NAD(P)(+) transhydrogenase (Re/Si-specific) subunit beta [Caulifigura sp.]|jgi:NAD(P) transhydrogenase subunit beta|nr:NAD(P)(+) transhydrogenase (Re/Si-specific) subunit beta [Caulifigura sp.]